MAHRTSGCSLFLYALANYQSIASDVYRKRFQRPGWQASDVFAVQFEMSVMAGAPDTTEVHSVLDDASEVSANCRKSPEFSS